MSDTHTYEVRFLNSEGSLIKAASLDAYSLSAVTEHAEAMAKEIGANSFYITSTSARVEK
jgi:hypothetical protein